MTSEPSVTHWIAGVKAGDAEAAQGLWNRYFQRLVVLAQDHLGVVWRGGADGEDVAQSVFKSLCLGAKQGKFPQLHDRNNLWMLLVPMTANKAIDLIRRERSLKRGAGQVMDEAALAGDRESRATLDDLVGHEPTPEFVAQMAEQCECLLSRLNVVERRTAELKLEAFSNQEIADQMDCAVRTVERRLEAVRHIWTNRC